MQNLKSTLPTAVFQISTGAKAWQMRAKASLSFIFLFLFSFPIFSQISDSLILCSGSNGQELTSTSPNGVFYDTGGPFGIYNNGEYCGLRIDPGCAESITITVHEYNAEICCDGLRFYDGVDQNAPLLLDMQYINAPQTMTFSTGQVFVRWYTDGSVVGNGFRVTWSSELVSPTPPVIDVFLASESNPALQEAVQFTAEASNYPQQWQWDFGDGTLSSEQNPSHAFNIPGTGIVRLIVTNCYNLSDTTELVLQVQEAPVAVSEPGVLDITLDCGSTKDTFINLINQGQGDLHFQFKGAGSSDKVRLLIYTYSAFGYSFDGIASELAAYPSSYDLVFSAETDPVAFTSELAESDVLIFPDIPPSSDSYQVLSGLKGAILDFVAAGGSIIFCGQEYGGNVLPLTDLFSSDFTNYYIQGSAVSFPVAHPITVGITGDYLTQYASMALFFTNPDYISLASVNDYSWLGYRQIGASKAIYLGSNFNQHDPTLGLLLHNALQWCGSRENITLLPINGVVEPGDTIQLDVHFSAEGLYAGDYSGTIKLAINNPANPVLELPYNLHVVGSAVLQASSDALDFGTIQQFGQAIQQVSISNPGCDTLVVQNISTGSTAFVAGQQQIEVLPFSEVTISVTFSPQDTGMHTAYLVFQSNAGTDSVSLTGHSLGAPVIAVSPSSLTATLTCGDSTSLPLIITNTGLGDLELTVSGAVSNIGPGALKILTIFEGIFSNYVAERTESAIVARFPDAQMTRFYGQDLSILPGLLADKNLVVVPFLGAESNAFYEQMGEALRPFVQAGGGLIFAGTNNPYGLNAFGILQCDTDIQDAYQYGMEAIEPQHPILQGVNLQTPAPDDLFIANFSSPGFKPLAGVSGFSHTAVGVQPLGAGRVVYIGHVFGNQNNDVLTLMENAVKWCALPTWLSVSSSTLMIPAGGSATIQVGFSAEGLTENTFLGNLLFSTNDPHNPTLNIPCTLIVVGEPQLVGIETSLHFGIIQQFAQKDLSIDFENIGCDTLNILSAISDNAAFQVLDFDAATLTNGTGKLFLRFAPILPGNQSANVTLLTDDGTFVVALTGIAVGAPVATVVPAEIGRAHV